MSSSSMAPATHSWARGRSERRESKTGHRRHQKFPFMSQRFHLCVCAHCIWLSPSDTSYNTQQQRRKVNNTMPRTVTLAHRPDAIMSSVYIMKVWWWFLFHFSTRKLHITARTHTYFINTHIYRCLDETSFWNVLQGRNATSIVKTALFWIAHRFFFKKHMGEKVYTMCLTI